MKIRIADRVLVALAGVLLLALCACVIAQSFFDVPVLQTVEGMLSGKKAIAWLPYVLCAVLLALSGYCIALLFRRRRGKRGFVLQDTDGGELSIALSAMDGLVCQCVAVHEEMQLLSSHFRNLTEGIGITFHGFGNCDPCTIDYIFVQGNIDGTESSKWDECRDGVWLSDHFPVCSELTLK